LLPDQPGRQVNSAPVIPAQAGIQFSNYLATQAQNNFAATLVPLYSLPDNTTDARQLFP
jgi:hypothetical protein